MRKIAALVMTVMLFMSLASFSTYAAEYSFEDIVPVDENSYIGNREKFRIFYDEPVLPFRIINFAISEDGKIAVVEARLVFLRICVYDSDGKFLYGYLSSCSTYDYGVEWRRDKIAVYYLKSGIRYLLDEENGTVTICDVPDDIKYGHADEISDRYSELKRELGAKRHNFNGEEYYLTNGGIRLIDLSLLRIFTHVMKKCPGNDEVIMGDAYRVPLNYIRFNLVATYYIAFIGTFVGYFILHFKDYCEQLAKKQEEADKVDAEIKAKVRKTYFEKK